MSVGKSRFATGADVVAMRTAFAVFLCLAVVAGSELSARSTRDKAHAAEVLKAPKDDAKTKKDKVIRALDKFPKKKVRTKAKDWRTRVPAGGEPQRLHVPSILPANAVQRLRHLTQRAVLRSIHQAAKHVAVG
jgi:hypothetical protein